MDRQENDLARRLQTVEQENKRLLETQVRLGEVTNNYLMLHYLNKNVHNCRTTRRLWETYLRNITDRGFNYNWVWVVLPGESGEFETKIFLGDGRLQQETIDPAALELFVKKAIATGVSQTSPDNTQAAVPIINNCNEIKGVLVTEKRYGITFEDLELLDVYAQQTVSTIENVTLNEKLIYFQDLLAKRLDQFVLLHYVSKEIHDTLDYFGALEKYLQISCSPMGLGFKNSAMYIVGETGWQKAVLIENRLRIVALEATDIVNEMICRAQRERCYQLDISQRRLAFPLLADNRVFAVMEVIHDESITDDQLQIFQIFAVQTSSVLDNRLLRLHLEEIVDERTQELKKAYDQLNEWNQTLEKRVEARTRELQAAKAAVEESHCLLEKANAKLLRISMLDGLTEVANRRQFNQVLEQEWQQSASQEISLIMLDVDRFKIYNDTYGHQAGDQVLQLVAETMEEVAADLGGLVSRYGGEEFAVLLPGIERFAAAELAEKIRQAVEGLAIENRQSGETPLLTVSLGVYSMWSGNGASPGDLIQGADTALYRAKQNGRNQVFAG